MGCLGWMGRNIRIFKLKYFYEWKYSFVSIAHGRPIVYSGYSAPDSPSGGTGFDPRQHPTCPRLTKPSILLRSVTWYQLRLGGEKSFVRPWGGECRAAVHSSFCSGSVSCKAGSGHFRCKSLYRKSGTLNFELISEYTRLLV